jgi:hypothetical protein
MKKKLLLLLLVAVVGGGLYHHFQAKNGESKANLTLYPAFPATRNESSIKQ